VHAEDAGHTGGTLAEGHAHVAHEWLCGPTGFAFVASNYFGVFEMGDPAPLAGTTRLAAQAPRPARWKLIRRGRVLQESTGARLKHPAAEPGVYRVEAWLEVDGELRPWIHSNPIYLPRPSAEALRLPPAELSPGVYVHDALDMLRRLFLEYLQKAGSAPEFVGSRIPGGFPENHEFGVGHRDALGLQQQIAKVLAAATAS